jgi:hypothetical protein
MNDVGEMTRVVGYNSYNPQTMRSAHFCVEGLPRLLSKLPNNLLSLFWEGGLLCSVAGRL